jgi:hypothetical protein
LTSFVELNQQRYLVSDEMPLPRGFRLIQWTPAWREALPRIDRLLSSGTQQMLAFSRVAISPDDSIALHYVEVHRAAFAWGEYVLLIKVEHEWRVLSHEWLWSGG